MRKTADRYNNSVSARLEAGGLAKGDSISVEYPKESAV